MGPFKCENCKLDFETNEELSNHKRKFCTDSDYNDLITLDNRLNRLRSPNDPASKASVLAMTTKNLMDASSHKQAKYE